MKKILTLLTRFFAEYFFCKKCWELHAKATQTAAFSSAATSFTILFLQQGREFLPFTISSTVICYILSLIISGILEKMEKNEGKTKKRRKKR